MSPKALSRQLNNSETAEPDILEFGCFYTHLGGDIMDPLYRAAVKGRVERKFAGKQDLQSKAAGRKRATYQKAGRVLQATYERTESPQGNARNSCLA